LCLSFTLDLTNQKAAEAEILQLNDTLEQRVQKRTNQLEEANQELQAFAYSVSHDLRAPLRGMQGFSQALLEDYGDKIDNQGQEYVRRIVAGASRMEDLIQDLLSYSRLSRAELRLQRLDLSNIVMEAMNQIESELKQRQAQVNVEHPLPQVMAHHSTLVQMVANLLSNAIKFLPDGDTPKVRVWAEQQGDWVRLWVEDNGIGIEPEYHQRIFRVFERLHGIESYPGTGIGLAIVRKGAERLGAKVGVESQLGEGSRFWIELPKAN
jgi:light-regulated signal transduction histidine kinase (bacteriophytochrome)